MRADYLAVPSAYGDVLRGMRWSLDGDAIEFDHGRTFILGQEVRAFLHGFASVRPLPHFGHILHLMYLIRVGRTPRHDFARLAAAWRDAGRPARTAGVFAAVLARDVPADPVLPHPLDSFALEALFDVRVNHPDDAAYQEPPLDAEVFEAIIACVLERFTDRDLVHWMKHGDAPADEAGEDLARELLESRPRSVAHALAEITRHERLAAAVPFVARLLGALSLPPRPLADPELPLGGYSDVTTRGQPEQILPGQFALDELEFLRRHAERELLYYRREEPSAQPCEELVVLLDQGVRTWGKVRLVLAACVFALGELAHRRKLTLLIATTGNGGRPVDPCAVGAGKLAELLATSDLGVSPALALESTLAHPADRPRDFVLLTQARNLTHPDVGTAARRLSPSSRLFTVGATAAGQVQLGEMRRGLPVALGSCQLDLHTPAAPPEPRPPTHRWTGDVEPVGFPFRFGLGYSQEKLIFEIDSMDEWILVAAPCGLLLTMCLDGSAVELLPRPLLDGQILTEVHELIGVPGGFLVLGAVAGAYVAAHYRFRERTCRVYDHRGPPTSRDAAEWRYLGSNPTLLLRVGDRFWSVHLPTGSRDRPIPATLEWHALPKGNRAWLPLGYREVVRNDNTVRWAHPQLKFESVQGRLCVDEEMLPTRTMTPQTNGVPSLAGLTLTGADYRNRTLAVLFTKPPTYDKALWLFDIHTEQAIASLPLSYEHDAFTLSPRGRLLAVQRGASQVQVREIEAGLALRCATPVGRFHNNVVVELGDRILVINIDRTTHLVRWETGELVAQVYQPGQTWPSLDLAQTRAMPGRVPGFLRHDRGRFRQAAWHNLIAVVSAYGEVFLFEHTGELVAGFFAFRQQLAGWLPDGTYLGPETLTGTPPRADASQRIGQALASAWERGERTVS